jgi:hypothetical protein
MLKYKCPVTGHLYYFFINKLYIKKNQCTAVTILLTKLTSKTEALAFK